MKIEDFLARLQGVTDDGKGGWMACCPAHEDHNPSMHVNVGRDGRILVKCFAGCSSDDIVSALGLEKRDLMAETDDKPAKRRKAAKAKKTASAPMPLAAAPKKPRDYGKLVCEYAYQREDGATVYKVQRRLMKSGKKTFVQMSPDPERPGDWRFGVEKWGVEYIPYQLPLIRKAAEAGRPVVIVEGEKDVLSVMKHLKLVATCNAKGAGKWPAGWGKYFEGVPGVLIIADKDPLTKTDKKTGEEKIFAVGQRHACDVEAKLRADGYVGKIRKIVLPDVEVDGEENGLKTVRMIKVKDFTDWAEALTEAGRAVDKSAFKAAIDGFGEWPDEWKYQGADLLDLARANKSARDSASSDAAQEGKEGGAEDGEGEEKEMGEAGRYGRLSPRTPSKEARLYEVDFQINSSHTMRFEVGIASIRAEGWEKSEAIGDFGKFRHLKDYAVYHGSVDQFAGIAIGQIYNFMGGRVKLAGPQISDLTCKLVMAWLRARGSFFANENNPDYETSMFFDEAEGILYGLHTAEFMSFLAGVANINRKLKMFDMIMSLIDDLAMDATLTPRVRPAKLWDKKGSAIYLSNGDSRIYRITAGAVDDVQNGTDGVLFLRGETFAPWTYRAGKGLDPFASATVFKTAAWTDTTSLMNVRLWYLNLFACHQNKPILLIEGPPQSGKTTIAMLLKHILGPRSEGKPDTNVNQVSIQEKGADDFWVIIDSGRLEIFDNMDSKIKWANDNLQTAATNGSHKVRELYKTKKVAILSANAYIIITSNNPIFAVDGGGLPDRIVQSHVGLGRKESLGNELTADIEMKRDNFLTWTADTLSAALADRQPVENSINRRHPDYGIFSIKCARALGIEKEAVRAMSAVEIDKSVLPLMNETVAKEIYATLMSQPTKGSMRFTSGEMSDAIIARFGEDDSDENTKRIYGSRRVGKTLSKFKREFGVIFKMQPERLIEGRTTYEFTGLTAQGESIATAENGGMVGFERDSAKVPIEIKGAEDLRENNPLNPPNPPYARAQTHDDPSLLNRKDIEKNGETEESEDLDDFDF